MIFELYRLSYLCADTYEMERCSTDLFSIHVHVSSVSLICYVLVFLSLNTKVAWTFSLASIMIVDCFFAWNLRSSV